MYQLNLRVAFVIKDHLLNVFTSLYIVTVVSYIQKNKILLLHIHIYYEREIEREKEKEEERPQLHVYFNIDACIVFICIHLK